MNDINVLIIASSDMDGTRDNYNLPENVINIEFPCNKYNGKTSNINHIYNIDSPKCKKCKYTKIEHEFKYPIFPIYNKSSMYSDLWINKHIVFERIKNIYGNNININYNTLTPLYNNNLEYLPTIIKINNIISNTLKLKGKISYIEPYHYSCNLDDIFKQKDFKNIKYDCIFVLSGGIGLLYTPENFKIIDKLLLNNSNKHNIIGNLFYKSNLEHNSFFGEFKFINPINASLLNETILSAPRKLINDCIKNYTKILLDNKYIEMYEMLYRNHKKYYLTKQNKI